MFNNFSCTYRVKRPVLERNIIEMKVAWENKNIVANEKSAIYVKIIWVIRAVYFIPKMFF